MNAKTEKLIKNAIELLNQAIEESDTEEVSVPEKSAPAKTATKAATPDKKQSSKKESAEYTEEDLKDMSYNDLKKLCKELGIPAIGSRAEIVDKIVNGEPEEIIEDDTEEEAPKTKGRTAPAKSAKKSAPAEEELEEEEEDEAEELDEDEDEEQTTLDLVKEATEDMTDEEIANLLIENGISAKGKRQALIDKLVKAIDDGIIEIGDEDEEDGEELEEEEKSTAKKSSKKAPKEEEAEEEDEELEEDEEVEENPDVLKFTKKRKATFDKRKKELVSARKSGKLKDKSISKYVNDYYHGEVDLDDLSADEIFEHYLELISLTIDDEGDIYDTEECYSINDNVYCCGHLCEFDESTGEYTCTECDSVYSTED